MQNYLKKGMEFEDVKGLVLLYLTVYIIGIVLNSCFEIK